MDTAHSFENGVVHMPTSTPPRRENEPTPTQSTLVEPRTRRKDKSSGKQTSIFDLSASSEVKEDQDENQDSLHTSSGVGGNPALYGLDELENEKEEEEEADEDAEEDEDEEQMEDAQGEPTHEMNQDEEEHAIALDAPPEGLSFLSRQEEAEVEEITKILDDSDGQEPLPRKKRSLQDSKEPPFRLQEADDTEVPAREFAATTTRSLRSSTCHRVLKFEVI
jgi:hypothetical protein